MDVSDHSEAGTRECVPSGVHRSEHGSIFHVINDLEQIGDHAIKILVQTEKAVEMGQGYTEAAQEELRKVYQMDMELLDETMKTFRDQQMTAEKWLELKLKERSIMIWRGSRRRSVHLSRDLHSLRR